MTNQEARDQALVAKAIADAEEGNYRPPEDTGLPRVVAAVLTLGVNELVRDEHAQEIYDTAYKARRS